MKNPAAPPKTRHVTMRYRITDIAYREPFNVAFTGASRFIWLARMRAKSVAAKYFRAYPARSGLLLETNVW